MRKRSKQKYICLRIFAAIVLIFVICAFMFMAAFVTRRLHKGEERISGKGFLDIVSEEEFHAPVYLNGEWEKFNDIVCKTEDDVVKLGDSQGYQIFPIGSLIQSERNASYRINISIPQGYEEELTLAIPSFDGEIYVYLNGILQEPLDTDGQWISLNSLKVLVPLTNIRRDQEYQELLISGEFAGKPVTLFKRPIVIGNLQNIATLTMFDSASQMFILGILILVLVNGFVFMLFRPNHKIITWITFFDSMIMVRVFFSMNSALALMKGMLPMLQLTDRFCRTAEVFFLMIAGTVGCILSAILFDPKRKCPAVLVYPPVVIYLFFSVLFTTNYEFFEHYGSVVLIFVYIYTFVGVFWEFAICWRETERRGYFMFQFVKTSYIGFVVFFDILLWNRYIDFSILLYLYIIFFIMHVIIRLYDNNQSYHDVEVLNQGLEETVAERTRELSEANQILSELSIRDPLTKIFNRLYFEKAMESAMEQNNKNHTSIHLCIFDLDFFKKVNDTYGHDAGDETLCRITSLVRDTVGTDAVFARIGGEEFVLLYEDKAPEQVIESIKAIHKAIRENAKQNRRDTTASFGVAACSEGDTEKTLMKKADRALYEAKEEGRNCIVAHIESEKLEELHENA